MARRADPMMRELKAIRERLSERLQTARLRGDYEQELKRIEREGDEWARSINGQARNGHPRRVKRRRSRRRS
jgi:hypothetical protein